MFPERVARHAGQHGREVRQLLDRLDLLRQVLALQEIRQLQRNRRQFSGVCSCTNRELAKSYRQSQSRSLLRDQDSSKCLPGDLARHQHLPHSDTKEGTHVRIVLLLSEPMQVQQFVIDESLHGQGSLHSFQT